MGNSHFSCHCYRPGNVFTPVCQSFCSQGDGCLPLVRGCLPHPTHPLGRPRLGRLPLGYTHTLPSACCDTHLPVQCMLGYTHPLPSACWDTHPHAQCMLGYSQQAGRTHPTGMHSCCCFLLLSEFNRISFFKFILLSCYENIERWNFERITPGCFVM